jgi:hypothetical protein
MLKQNAVTAILGAGALGVLTLVAVRAQQRDAKVSTLTEMDYIEIQQLVARYAFTLDTHADNGYAYANLFTPDATFGGKKMDRESLAALAMKTQAERGGPAYVRHFLTNVIIKPSPEGATGRQYLVAIDVGEGGKPSTIIHGGHYDDVYVKTPAGWRFKSRALTPSKIGPKPPEAEAVTRAQ